MIALIWAMDNNNLIGCDNKLPWSVDEELQYFKKITLNKTILMGFNTFASINYRPLPNRKTIVITRKTNYQIDNPNVIISNDLKATLKKYKHQKEILFVAGGKEIYQNSWKAADFLYVSIIKGNYSGDLYFFEHSYDEFNLIDKQEYEKFTTFVYERSK